MHALMAAHYGGASSPKMSFYELQDHFFQLDTQRAFTPAETRLYFWWLNQFNAEHWPASLPRKLRQVAATLSMDEKTVDKAAQGLQHRGLLSYEAGNKTVSAVWWLAYQKPAAAPQMDRKNSGQPAPDSPQMGRKNSGPFAEKSPDSPQMDRKNSGHIYKDKTKTKEEEDKDPLTPGAGEASPGVLPLAEQPNGAAPLPPVAAPPLAPEAELSDDEFGRYKAIPRDAAMVDAHLHKIGHPKAGKGQIFFDYYEARGWRHGQYNHPCQNWKALISGFGFRETSTASPSSRNANPQQPAASSRTARLGSFGVNTRRGSAGAAGQSGSDRADQ